MVGRIATAVVVVSGIMWIPLMKVVSGGGIYTYLQSVQAYIAPPIASVFLFGLFWSRINASGAMAALVSGFTAGMIRLGLEINKARTVESLSNANTPARLGNKLRVKDAHGLPEFGDHSSIDAYSPIQLFDSAITTPGTLEAYEGSGNDINIGQIGFARVRNIDEYDSSCLLYTSDAADE